MADEEFNHVWDLLQGVVQDCLTAGISKQDMFPPFIDFLASVGIIVGGEPVVRAIITRLENRIEDWNAGRFPAQQVANDGPN